MSACGAASREVVARIGGTAITKAALDHWVATGAARSADAVPGIAAPTGSLTLRQRTLALLLSSARTLEEGREAGIVVSGQEAAKALSIVEAERRLGLSPSAGNMLQSRLGRGETRADMLQIVTATLVEERIERRVVERAERLIPQSRVARYYRAHKRDFAIPERRDVAVFQNFHKQQAELARRELRAGKSLSTVLQRRNEEEAVGGLKRNMTLRSLRHDYERDYFKAKPHVLVGPRKAEIYYMFEVVAVKPPRQQTLAEVEGEIRRTLVERERHRLLAAAAQALADKWRSRTRCLPSYAIELCGARLS